ncbi:hypothetical protein SAMN05216260_1109 [Streptomyces griseoaurantiacus]|uniref:Uncharacterized protein n=1 Tax=Streptomyces griseoaurantiacus TaxID=68213 RepID=A0A1G7N4N6_9ACTN|nr:hypothetical protein [Streptomyces sp. MH192]MCF0102409.1 hypothetical protein [Streptomyces sp. MH191]SDF68319.1 hypothetical protein SAMN05216260_1109 [Streptomyces jietaisiensis]
MNPTPPPVPLLVPTPSAHELSRAIRVRRSSR